MAQARSLALLLLASTLACGRDPEVLKREHLSRGNDYAARKDYDAAIIEYRNALQQDPQFGEARSRLAEAHIQIGDGTAALREAVRAANLLPADTDAQVRAANLLVLAGRFADARDRALAVLERDGNHVRALVVLGNSLAGLDDLDGGIRRIEEAIRLEPERAGSYTNLGALQAAAGRAADAEGTYRKAMAAAPDSPAPRLAMAQLHWLTGRIAEAESYLQEALARSPGDVLANRFAAAFYQTTRQPEKAEQYLRTAVEAEGTTTARLTLAEYYLALSRRAEAAAVLRELTADQIVGPIATVRLAVIDYAEGRLDEAVTAIDGVLARNPRQVQALLAKASMLFDEKQYDDALARIEAALAVEPDSAQAHFARGRLLVARHKPEDAREAFNESLRLLPRAAGARVELAKLHLLAQSPGTAVAMAGAATKIDPRRLDARLVLARGLMARGDLIQAESVLKELTAAAPQSAAVHAQVGVVRSMKKDRAGAAAAFERAVGIDPLQLDAIYGLTALDLETGRPEAARRRIDALVAHAPGHPEVLTLAGRVRMQMRDAAGAEQALERALDLDPGALPAYSLLGTLYLQQQRLDDARREFERLTERQAQPVTAFTMIGLIHQMQNNVEGAKRAFERAVEIDPNTPVAANNLAWIYAETGEDLNRALELAQAAKAGLPKNAEVTNTLGWVYYKKGLWPLAISTLREAVEMEPSNPTFHYQLGLAYVSAGDQVSARRTLSAALALKRDFEGATDASRLLASL